MSVFRLGIHVNGVEAPAFFILKPRDEHELRALQMLERTSSIAAENPTAGADSGFVIVEELSKKDLHELGHATQGDCWCGHAHDIQEGRRAPGA